jgi:MYXO-CTERM domain-containing protein
MSLVLVSLLSAAPAVVPQCAWDRPDANPFVGDVVAAVDTYQDIPAAARERLKARIAKRDYDDRVTIWRDMIVGAQRYNADVRDMHFADGKVCQSVSREPWPASAQEHALAYCEDQQCVVVPTANRNVSRVSRVQPSGASGTFQGVGHGSELGFAALPAPARLALSLLTGTNETIDSVATAQGATGWKAWAGERHDDTPPRTRPATRPDSGFVLPKLAPAGFAPQGQFDGSWSPGGDNGARGQGAGLTSNGGKESKGAPGGNGSPVEAPTGNNSSSDGSHASGDDDPSGSILPAGLDDSGDGIGTGGSPLNRISLLASLPAALAIPEPSTGLLGALALLALWSRARRDRSGR